MLESKPCPVPTLPPMALARFLLRPIRGLIPFLCLASLCLHAAQPLTFEPAHEPAPADNPLKGFVPYADQGRQFPHSLEFGYLPLAAMMTGPDQFDWGPMDRLLDGIASRSCQAVFRVYLEYPGKPTGVPKHLIDAGLRMRMDPLPNGKPLRFANVHSRPEPKGRLRLGTVPAR